jgi:hypothetical protein
VGAGGTARRLTGTRRYAVADSERSEFENSIRQRQITASLKHKVLNLFECVAGDRPLIRINDTQTPFRQLRLSNGLLTDRDS